MRYYPILIVAAALAAGVAVETPSLAQSGPEQTVLTATNVLNEIMEVPVSSIPQNLLADAHGLAIIPGVIKGGFVVGVRHGRGVVLVRDGQVGWRPPVFVSLTGGSIGWQAGLQATDVILVFRTAKGIQGLLDGTFTIGADAAAAAGPVGRQVSAATDAQLRAEILSYSRSRGLFAGVSLEGSMLQIDQATTQMFYQSGALVTAPAGALGSVPLPQSAVQLLQAVARHTGRPGIAQPANQPAVPPLHAGVGAAPRVASEAELRGQLAVAWQRLQGLLDDSWRQFLTLPAGTLEGTSPPDLEPLKQAVNRFDTVAHDPQFAALAQRPEFQAVHQLLRSYLSARTAAAPSLLNLPPPPQPGDGPADAPQFLFR